MKAKEPWAEMPNRRLITGARSLFKSEQAQESRSRREMRRNGKSVGKTVRNQSRSPDFAPSNTSEGNKSITKKHKIRKN